jgi:gas vesicle protein
MPDYSGALSAGMTGYKVGSMIPIPGAGIVGGAVGALSGLFSDSEEEIRRKRQEELKKQNEQYRMIALARANQLKQGGIKDISKETATQVGRSQSDVSRRAAALGRTGDIESMLLPVTSRINEAGGKNLETAIQSYDTGINNINSQYDTAAMRINSDFAARPIEPNISDNLTSIGSSIIQGGNYDKYLKAMTDIYGNKDTPSTSASPNAGLLDNSPSIPAVPNFNRSSDITFLPSDSSSQSPNVIYQPQNDRAWKMNRLHGRDSQGFGWFDPNNPNVNYRQ